MFSRYFLVACLLVQAGMAIVTVDALVSCKDQNNKDVDWFIMYNAPKAGSTKGGEFVYVDSSTTDSHWTVSSQSILEDNNPLAYSVAPLFGTSSRAEASFEEQTEVAARDRSSIIEAIVAVITAAAAVADASASIVHAAPSERSTDAGLNEVADKISAAAKRLATAEATVGALANNTYEDDDGDKKNTQEDINHLVYSLAGLFDTETGSGRNASSEELTGLLARGRRSITGTIKAIVQVALQAVSVAAKVAGAVASIVSAARPRRSINADFNEVADNITAIVNRLATAEAAMEALANSIYESIEANEKEQTTVLERGRRSITGTIKAIVQVALQAVSVAAKVAGAVASIISAARPTRSIDADLNEVADQISAAATRLATAEAAIEGITNKKKDLMYVLYNDQPPRGLSRTKYAHSKGIAIFDDKTGVWIQHSMPGFLDISAGKYSFPESAHTHAQLVMCVTLPAEEAGLLADHLMVQDANIYHKSPPSKLSAGQASMERLLRDTSYISPPGEIAQTRLHTLYGTHFVSIAKSATWNKDIYSDFIATNVTEDNLVVHSLTKGDKMGSVCRGNRSVLNTESITLRMRNQSWTWKSTRDQSKWAVAVNKPWFCFGSLDRTVSEKKRGGEATCMENAVVHRLFISANEGSEHC